MGLLLLLQLVMPVSQPSRRVPTYEDLNRDRAHIEIFVRDEGPAVALYATPALTGSPVLRLTADGLFVNGKFACSWPGGRFDGSSARMHLMVLGYADADATDYRGCPSGLPIKSYWAYQDGRVPKLVIEVTARRGALIETGQGRAKYYFDLNALPGDPVVRGEPMDSEWARVVRRKGESGWHWVESARDSDARTAAALARFRKDPTFPTFLRDVRACLSSALVPACFARFVKPQIYYGPLSGVTGKPNATPEEFVDFLWRERRPFGSRPWDLLVACFTVVRLEGADERHVRLDTDEGWCDVDRTEGPWLLRHVAN